MKLEKYIKDHNIKCMAVYGMSETGKKWYRYLERISTLQHVFGIEKLNYAIETEYEKYMLYGDELPEMDAVLIVPWRKFDFVKWELYSYVPDDCIFLSIQDFADELV